MRLHQLDATAFGPFAETVSVDFDDLSSAGLFLLTGPTGSGKTSILDAVCFAMYGDVPGDRNHAKRFRCDTADPRLAPRVRLEATLSGRRFRITRSPAWVRPKKRGTGLTTEQASVRVEERISGEWVMQSTRLDEAGHLLTGLVGMTMTQFCQVAMLPQGEFQKFLRASSNERHALLQQLFSTQRFEDIERWIRDHTRALHRQGQELQRSVSRVVSRILEATGETLPDDWSGDDLAPVMADGILIDWVDALRAQTRAADDEATAALAASVEAERAAGERREEAHRVAGLQQRATAARTELAELAASADRHESRRGRLALARRAAPVVPLHRLALAAEQQRDRAVEAAATALSRVAGPDEVVDLDTLVRRARASRDTISVATAAVPREGELRVLRERIAGDRSRLEHLQAEEVSTANSVDALPEQISSLRQRLGLAREADVESQRLAAERGVLDARLEAHTRAAELRDQLTLAVDERRASIDECQLLKEQWLQLCEARIRGMAAEIATDLAVGASCPVCGSADHPHKAEAAPGAPTAAAEKEARRLLDDAEVDRVARDARVHELSATLAVVEQQLGDDSRETTRAERVRIEAARSAAAHAARATGELEPALILAERSLQSAANALSTCRVEIASRRARLESDSASEERIAGEINDLLAGTGHDDLAALAAHHERIATACDEVLRLERARETAVEQADKAVQALDTWLHEHDFADAAQALDAVLSDREAHELESAISAHDSRSAAASAVLGDPVVAQALELPAPDVDAVDTDHARALDELGSARTLAQTRRTRSTRLGDLHEQLGLAHSAWLPVHWAYAVAAELASFVEGKSADNELRMRLSAYVLAWRLTQVVAAANERLLRMSDQRYSLEHTGHRGAGESRGGLSLLVLDEWSGERRDPATLSGGETFVVSLALALGLADVVTQEAGGAELDTLFVDEGFGSLDSDTLDDVMDTLDTLRDGGRVVGVVSHVAEMRSRIPTQLRVAKDRTGSSVTISRVDG
ncbi:AAA family ATPase [Nocardioides sp. Root151]|uniref:AAA family ATPase n=1 Tax=Nocardioides sp. Root151 TaxID=1736475 RepID=UPI000702EE48|nr:SMC family ATPase [Nocardioides sp. Root151]KQZ70468.1 hypothetical protein ASD66_12715 [Nocardioides sp. Root151]